MLLKITHKTQYLFKAPVRYGLQQLRVIPKTRDSQRVIDWQIELIGAERQGQFEDQHNNTVLLVSADSGVTKLTIECKGEVETTDTAGVIGQHGGFAPLWYFKRETDLTKPGKGVRKLISQLGSNHDDEVARMHALSNLIADNIAYKIGATDASTKAEDAIDLGNGVCQDHAHVMLSAARSLGFPARYVSGYLMLNERVEQDAGHAWVEVHIEPLGWVGFDISNRISPDERYVRVATGLDYSDAAPVSGLHFTEPGLMETDLPDSDTMLVNIGVQQ